VSSPSWVRGCGHEGKRKEGKKEGSGPPKQKECWVNSRLEEFMERKTAGLNAANGKLGGKEETVVCGRRGTGPRGGRNRLSPGG